MSSDENPWQDDVEEEKKRMSRAERRRNQKERMKKTVGFGMRCRRSKYERQTKGEENNVL